MSHQFKLVNASTVPVTRQLAREFWEMEASPTERDVSQSRIKMLQDALGAGQLITFNWATAKLGKKRLRMNGQHSSKFLTELQGDFPEGLFAHIDEYEVSDKFGLATLFQQFDNRKSSRTVKDLAGAYLALEDNLSVNLVKAKLAVDGCVWYRRNIDQVPVPSDVERYTLFYATGLHEFIRWVDSLLNDKTSELKREGVVAAMHGTFIANEAESRKFWESVARGGDQFDPKAPESILDAWLQQPKTVDVRKSKDIYQGCIFAWNAKREDKTIGAIKFDSHKGFSRIVI